MTEKDINIEGEETLETRLLLKRLPKRQLTKK